jgi:hypothetical protein
MLGLPLVPDLAGWRRQTLPELPDAAGTWRGDATVRAEPFDAVALPLAVLWAR